MGSFVSVQSMGGTSVGIACFLPALMSLAICPEVRPAVSLLTELFCLDFFGVMEYCV